MKKYSWIVVLLLALSLALIGCPDKEPPPDEGELAWTTVFDMATDEGIQALTVGKLAIGSSAGGSSPIKPLQEAGEGDNHVIISAVAGPGDQKIALTYEATANWGAGIDLPYPAFGFRLGDKITITGDVLDIGAAGSYAQANIKVGAEDSHGFKVTEAGPFTWEIELTDAWLNEIKRGSPPAIRLEGRGSGGNSVPTGQKVQINNIHIEGNRPTNIVALPAPVVTVTETGVEWAAVEGAGGYNVFVDDAEEPIATLGDDKTSVNLNSIRTLDPGTYSITVVALGVTGNSKDSPKSTPVSYTKPEPETASVVLTIDSDDYFDYAPGDGPGADTLPVSLKGNIKSDVTAEILSYTNGEVWLYWEYVGSDETGRGNNYGIGAFGGKSYNTGTDSDGFSGIVIIPISDLDLSAQPSYVPADQLYLNPYSDCAIVKIEVYAGGAGGDFYELGEFTETSGANQGILGFNGVNGDLDWDALVAAKYLVIETKGSNNRDGFGGLQVILQGDGNEYDWAQNDVISGWLSFANAEDETVYIVIQLDTLAQYEDVIINGTKGKITIAMYPLSNLGYVTSYLVGDMDKPSDAVDFEGGFGYITKGE